MRALTRESHGEWSMEILSPTDQAQYDRFRIPAATDRVTPGAGRVRIESTEPEEADHE